MLSRCSNGCKQDRSFERMRGHIFSQLLCLGRHTITGLIKTSGQQYADWTAQYRMYSKNRFDEGVIFQNIRKGVEDFLDTKAPLVVAMDDSLLRKAGRKTPGVSWRRDPLGPPFQTNLVRAQRVLQLSAALPDGQGGARMIPIDYIQAPTPQKPKKTAPELEWANYYQKQKECNINNYGLQRISKLKEQMNQSENHARDLWITVDNRFMNKTILKKIPQNIVLIGRIRKDTKLYNLPTISAQLGRKKVYGHQLPTPEQMRHDDAIPWEKVPAFSAGTSHEFKIKRIPQVRWRAAGQNHTFQLIIIAPLAYRLRAGAKLLYRDPAYLICTEQNLPIQQTLQAYLWRWDIEVNFRDEKTILGVGDTQVFNANSVQKAPSLAVAAYSLLLLAAARTFGVSNIPGLLPLPKWRNPKLKRRPSTQDLTNTLRFDCWAKAISKSHFSGFLSNLSAKLKPKKFAFPLQSALFFSTS